MSVDADERTLKSTVLARIQFQDTLKLDCRFMIRKCEHFWILFPLNVVVVIPHGVKRSLDNHCDLFRASI